MFTLLLFTQQQQVSPNFRPELTVVQTSIRLQALLAQTSAYMLEKLGWICILFPFPVRCLERGGKVLKSNCLLGWGRKERERVGCWVPLSKFAKMTSWRVSVAYMVNLDLRSCLVYCSAFHFLLYVYVSLSLSNSHDMRSSLCLRLLNTSNKPGLCVGSLMLESRL